MNNETNGIQFGTAEQVSRLVTSNAGFPTVLLKKQDLGPVLVDAGLPDDSLPPVVRVLFAMKAELERARGKHGPQDYGNWKWSSVLMEEVGEAAQEINDYEENTSTAAPAERRAYLERLYKEVIQCGAMALGWAEKLQGRIKAIS